MRSDDVRSYWTYPQVKLDKNDWNSTKTDRLDAVLYRDLIGVGAAHATASVLFSRLRLRSRKLWQLPPDAAASMLQSKTGTATTTVTDGGGGGGGTDGHASTPGVDAVAAKAKLQKATFKFLRRDVAKECAIQDMAGGDAINDWIRSVLSPPPPPNPATAALTAATAVSWTTAAPVAKVVARDREDGYNVLRFDELADAFIAMGITTARDLEDAFSVQVSASMLHRTFIQRRVREALFTKIDLYV